MHAKLCALKASFNSMSPISSRESPAFLNAFCVALTGPIPMIRGSTPTTAEATILTIGVRLCCFIALSEATITAAAPSLSPLALPAVTVPSFLNAVLNLARASREVSCLINSSSLKMRSSFFLCGIAIGTISFASLPDS